MELICNTCKKECPEQELEDNSKYSYGYICDKCADKLDQKNDEQQQDK